MLFFIICFLIVLMTIISFIEVFLLNLKINNLELDLVRYYNELIDLCGIDNEEE